ncbi:MAG TPA: stalk domain-containing protein [Symbiobacteriaceae bacterium]|jgi:plastocyanin
MKFSALRLFLMSVLVACLAALALTEAQAAPATTIVLTIGQQVATVNGDTVQLDTAPVIDAASGRTFVPVRFVGETLGAYVGWDGTVRKVTYLTGDTRIELVIGQKIATVNGKSVTLDAAPYIDTNSRTMVPVRFVSEQLGATVSWDGTARTVTIVAPWVGKVVQIKGFQFAPASLTVAPGTRVTWVDLDQREHTVTGSGWGSATLDNMTAYSFTFGAPGTFDYQCDFHTDMLGSIIVK